MHDSTDPYDQKNIPKGKDISKDHLKNANRNIKLSLEMQSDVALLTKA